MLSALLSWPERTWISGSRYRAVQGRRGKFHCGRFECSIFVILPTLSFLNCPSLRVSKPAELNGKVILRCPTSGNANIHLQLAVPAGLVSICKFIICITRAMHLAFLYFCDLWEKTMVSNRHFLVLTEQSADKVLNACKTFGWNFTNREVSVFGAEKRLLVMHYTIWEKMPLRDWANQK